MIRDLRQIQLQWSLSTPELAALSHVSEPVLSRWLASGPEDVAEGVTIPSGLEPAVPLISIFRSLQKLRPDLEHQVEWLKKPNTILEDQIPIQVMMMSPAHLAWVSYTLDSAVRQANL